MLYICILHIILYTHPWYAPRFWILSRTVCVLNIKHIIMGTCLPNKTFLDKFRVRNWGDRMIYVNANLIICFQTALKPHSLGQKSVVTVYSKFSRLRDGINFFNLTINCVRKLWTQNWLKVIALILTHFFEIQYYTLEISLSCLSWNLLFFCL